MELLSTPIDFAKYCNGAARLLGLVPTMGSIHVGHLELVNQAKAECNTVVASLFVNPMQFGDQIDFLSYPRDSSADLLVLESSGVDALYMPGTHLVFPQDFTTSISVNGPALGMEGSVRPGHFEGVATIVAKLLIGSNADNAYFGRKDGQQVAVIKRMVTDLDMQTQIREVETSREPDGLAISSRNVLLSPKQRATAPILYQALLAGQKAFEDGERQQLVIINIVKEILSTDGDKSRSIDYVEMVEPESMTPWISGKAMLVGAIRLGDIRIIDNVILVENNIDDI